MNVTEIMASAVQILAPEENVVEAARVMKQFDIGCVLVGSADRVEGILTDRDIVLRGVASGHRLSNLTLGELMTPDPTFCSIDDTVQQAAGIMEKLQVRRLPVLNTDRTLAGIITLGDICTHAPHDLAGELIEELSSPVHHELAKTA